MPPTVPKLPPEPPESAKLLVVLALVSCWPFGPAPGPIEPAAPPGPGVPALALPSSVPLTVMVVPATTTSGTPPLTTTLPLNTTLCAARTATARLPGSLSLTNMQPAGTVALSTLRAEVSMLADTTRSQVPSVR